MPKEPTTKREAFETLYTRLEEHVEKLERGGLSLDESIALYEQGMTLARACQERLEEAEQKITKLRESFAAMPRSANGVRDDGGPAEDYEYVADDDEPFDPEADVP
jgi:exodeoxyribonuclease VII small subunit